MERASAAPPARDFRAALTAPASRSFRDQAPVAGQGALKLDMDAPTMARTYAMAGASASRC
jgi:hypothetical protein